MSARRQLRDSGLFTELPPQANGSVCFRVAVRGDPLYGASLYVVRDESEFHIRVSALKKDRFPNNCRLYSFVRNRAHGTVHGEENSAYAYRVASKYLREVIDIIREGLAYVPPDTLYEKRMLSLFREAGFAAEYKKTFNGKTPDLLVQADDRFRCVVECTTVHWEGRHTFQWDENGIGHLMVDDSDPHNRNRKLWESIERKLWKYSDAFPGYGLVIAVYNWSLANDDSDAVEVCFGQYNEYLKVSDGEVVARGWERALDPPAIFEDPANQHCSAIIHSTHLFALDWVDGKHTHVDNAGARHLLIPNPRAVQPVPEYLFSFCDVLDLPRLRNSDGSTPTRKPRT